MEEGCWWDKGDVVMYPHMHPTHSPSRQFWGATFVRLTIPRWNTILLVNHHITTTNTTNKGDPMAFHSFAAIIVKDARVPLSARELSAAVRLEQVSPPLRRTYV